MESLHDVMTEWHDFFVLLGTAAGTLVGLLFVAATVSSGVFSLERRAPLRMFLSATVVHFSSVLVLSLVVLGPIENWSLLGVLVLAGGLLGIAYCGLVWRDARRDGLSAAIDLEDRVWYVVLPVAIYLCEVASGVMLAVGSAAGGVALAVALTLLLVVGIHNAWDITIWTVTRRQG